MEIPQFGRINPINGIISGDKGLYGLTSLILAVIQLGLVVIVVLAFFFLVFGGIKWIMSGGDKQGVAQARGMVTYALIGLVLGFLVFLILRIVSGVFQFDLGAGISTSTN